ncbi:glycerophosphodiester phosphodiesterase family protein [Larkinella bovis]|uniref:Glycerophosphodiester phosphodiesterase family protein n=1 Tax=Larkinella bovis TaxID=683041 RepID=A0ABW0ICX8_9BACT
MLRTAFAFICLSCFVTLSFQARAQSLHPGVTAHRGNSSQFPENTLPAFQSALSLGVDWVELDVYKTKDGKLVVLHDATTGRVGDQNLVVANVTYEQLKKVDVAAGFRKRTGKSVRECPPQRIPLLEEALNVFARQSKTRVSIQPKTDCVAEAIALVRKKKMEKMVGFNDGNLTYMATVKKLAPNIPVFWDRPANSDIQEDIRIAKEHGFESLVINGKGLTEEKINQLKIARIEPGVWTVNERDDLIRFLDMGVARIYTDDPALLIDLKKVHQTIVCEGAYEGHLQGICTDQKSSIYWSWTKAVVRTDRQGKILASVAAPSHQGDLCYRNGKLYVAVNLGAFNKPAGSAKSWVYEYDGITLQKLNEYPVPELVHGAGGMEYHDGKFMLVGGLVPGMNENYLYEYDEKFRFIRRHTVASGYTLMGIQTIAYANGTWWLGCYGKPPVTLRTDDRYQFQGQTVFDASLGIAPYSRTHMWIGSNVRLPGQGHVGRVRLVEIEKIAK